MVQVSRWSLWVATLLVSIAQPATAEEVRLDFGRENLQKLGLDALAKIDGLGIWMHDDLTLRPSAPRGLEARRLESHLTQSLSLMGFRSLDVLSRDDYTSLFQEQNLLGKVDAALRGKTKATVLRQNLPSDPVSLIADLSAPRPEPVEVVYPWIREVEINVLDARKFPLAASLKPGIDFSESASLYFSQELEDNSTIQLSREFALPMSKASHYLIESTYVMGILRINALIDIEGKAKVPSVAELEYALKGREVLRQWLEIAVKDNNLPEALHVMELFVLRSSPYLNQLMIDYRGNKRGSETARNIVDREYEKLRRRYIGEANALPEIVGAFMKAHGNELCRSDYRVLATLYRGHTEASRAILAHYTKNK